MTPTDWVAAYAAVVATGALFLEVRRWFEAGVRFRLTATHAYSTPSLDDHVVLVTATNIGESTTQITSLEIWGYPSLLSRVLRKSLVRGVILDTTSFASLSPLPFESTPGSSWQGSISPEAITKPEFRHAYAAVRTTRYEKPFFVRIRN